MEIRREKTLAAPMGIIALAMTPLTSAASAEKPNILIIMSDDVGTTNESGPRHNPLFC